MSDKDKQQQQDRQPPARREALDVYIRADADGAILISGKADELRRLFEVIDKACKRIADGDGSITVPRNVGKKRSTLTVVAT